MTSDLATLEHGPVLSLTSLLDSGLGPIGPGDPLPPLWHWVALPQWPSSSMLSRDGHPHRGSFLPPIDLPRRMFAGGSSVQHAPLKVGATIRREERVVSVVPKEGRTGSLVLVDVEARLHDVGTGQLLVEEHRHLVFREGSTSSTTPPAPPLDQDPPGPPLRTTSPRTWSVATDPSLLMRFSAATANPHRIHYDWPYATGVEGHRGLVVHGPLTLLLMIEVLRLHGTTVPLGTPLEFRNLSPLICGDPAEITLSPDGTSVLLSTIDGRAVTRLDLGTPTKHQKGTL